MALKEVEGAASIVLVSDGVESCGKDPCEVARQLRERHGIDLVVHVVGFDVHEGQEQLQCIAEAGGGRFLLASNAAELASAFEDVKQELAKADAAEPPPVSAEPVLDPINVAAAENGGRIVLHSSQYDAGTWAAGNLIDGGP